MENYGSTKGFECPWSVHCRLWRHIYTCTLPTYLSVKFNILVINLISRDSSVKSVPWEIDIYWNSVWFKRPLTVYGERLMVACCMCVYRYKLVCRDSQRKARGKCCMHWSPPDPGNGDQARECARMWRGCGENVARKRPTGAQVY